MGPHGPHHSRGTLCEQGKGASGPGRVGCSPGSVRGVASTRRKPSPAETKCLEGLSWHRWSWRSQACLQGPFELTAQSKEAYLFHMTYQSRHSCL